MTNVELVQLLIGDSTGDLFTAVQIQGFLDLTAVGGIENVYAAASAACQSLAASGVLLSKIERIGNYSLSRATLTEKYLKLADTYETKVDEVPAVGVIEQSWTPENAFQIVFNNALRGL